MESSTGFVTSPRPKTPPGRMVQDRYSLIGKTFDDPKQSDRSWTITSLYSPINRALGGIRARVMDTKGFISFINQRDMELLLELARPGEWCAWAHEYYPGVNDEVEGWYGLALDPDDLLDDLYERELELRVRHPDDILQPQEIRRRLHFGPNNDMEELVALLWDADPDTGLGPDYRFETLEKRWSRIEKSPLKWQMIHGA